MMRMLTSLTLVVALFGTSCATTAVRDNVLFPVAIAAYQGVLVDIQYVGSEMDIVNAEILRLALSSRDVPQLLVAAYLWYDLRDVAQAGIEAQVVDGVISVGVGVSKQERLRNFEIVLVSIGVLEAVSDDA